MQGLFLDVNKPMRQRKSRSKAAFSLAVCGAYFVLKTQLASFLASASFT